MPVYEVRESTRPSGREHEAACSTVPLPQHMIGCVPGQEKVYMQLTEKCNWCLEALRIMLVLVGGAAAVAAGRCKHTHRSTACAAPYHSFIIDMHIPHTMASTCVVRMGVCATWPRGALCSQQYPAPRRRHACIYRDQKPPCVPSHDNQ